MQNVNKSEVYAEFDVDEYGTIRTHGKFEAESWIAPIVYDWYGNGDRGEEIIDHEGNAKLIAAAPALLEAAEAALADIEAWMAEMGWGALSAAFETARGLRAAIAAARGTA